MNVRSRSIVMVLGVAVVAHAAVLAGTTWRDGALAANAFKSLDAVEYYHIAQNLAFHGRYSQATEPPYSPDTWRTPGYPLFLAAMIAFLGDKTETLIVVQQVLGVFNALLVFLLAGRFMSDRRALCAALLFIVEPYQLYYSTWLLATTLFVTLLLLLWHVWQIAVQEERAGWYLLVGVLAGILILIRPAGLLVPFALGAWLVFGTGRSIGFSVGSSHRIRRGSLLFLLAFVLGSSSVVGLWVVRNKQVAGRASLSSQGGAVLAYFKAAEVVLWRQGRASDRYIETSLDSSRAGQVHSVWDEIDRQLRRRMSHLDSAVRATLRWPNLAQGNKTTLDSFAVSDALWSIGWDSLSASPVATATCCLIRCGSLLTFPFNLAIRPAAGVESGMLRHVALALPYMVLCALVAIRLLRGYPSPRAMYFPLAVTAALLLTATPQLDPRFRAPLIPCLIVVALLPTIRQHNQRRPVEPL